MKPEIRSAFVVVAALAGLLLAPARSFGWGDNGHRVVGQVGEDRLSPAAAAAVRPILGGLSLAQIATWPDFIRSEPAWDFVRTWHYMTVEDGQSVDDILTRDLQTPEPDEVVEAIGYFADILRGDAAKTAHFEKLMRDKKATPYRGSTQLTALAFLVHFLGDIHQPLHVGRGNDIGANAITVNWFGETKNLHSVWDSGLIESEELSFTELARFVENEFGGDPSVPAAGTPADWARESIGFRGQVYAIWGKTSRTNFLPDLGYDYAYVNMPTVKRRLYQGGARLAALLGSIFP